MRNALDIFRGDSWSPMRELSTLHRDMDRIFNELMTPYVGPVTRGTSSEWTFNPACDVEETNTHYLMSFDLPGVNKEDVKLELENNVLVVSGERKSERKEDKKSRHFEERYYGSFRRSFTLPTTVDPEKVEASFDNGVLRIALPKAETAKTRQIKIGEAKSGLLGKLFGPKEEKAGERSGSPTKAA